MERSTLLRTGAVTVLGGGGLTVVGTYLVAQLAGIWPGYLYLVVCFASLLPLPVLWGVTDLAYDSGYGGADGVALGDSLDDPHVEGGSIPYQFVLGLYCVGVAVLSAGMVALFA